MDTSVGDANFYDRVAARFGEYRTGARYETKFRTENAERVFQQKLTDLGGPEVTALDAGSGDGRFTLSMARYFRRVVGIDTSQKMLAVAQRRAAEQGITNVLFEYQDASATRFPDASFDVVYSRRGPTKYREYDRLLRPGGAFLHVGIGEQDALQLKQIFGRGQGFDRIHSSWLARSRDFQEEAGLNVVYGEDFLYDEYFLTFEDLETFLQGVPIFEDFDPVADRERLQAYVEQAQTTRGIHMLRHRFVTVAVKP